MFGCQWCSASSHVHVTRGLDIHEWQKPHCNVIRLQLDVSTMCSPQLAEITGRPVSRVSGDPSVS
jgi:hypothetical protein